ncbi:MAG: M20/M25/M40 family metallo-hydrolase [Oscillospiraceae bacterium]|nr:M20/M25/M40 family metallo-hydrolase [Oscillospiraceae bacterium]
MKTKSVQRVWAIIIILAMILSGSMQALGAQGNQDVFLDIAGHWARETILNAYETNLVSGYSDGTFRPNASITRAETVTILNTHFGITSGETVHFTDVAYGTWFYDAIAAAIDAGYVSGFPDNTFRPNANLTRLHAALMIYRLSGSPEPNDVNVVDDFADAAETLANNAENTQAVAFFVENQIMHGYADQTLRLDNAVTRAEFLTLLMRSAVLADNNIEEDDVPLGAYPLPPATPTTLPITGGGGGGGIPRTADERAVALVCVNRTWDSIYYMSVEIGTRVGGMAGERRAIEWLIAEFEALGLETEIHEFDAAVQTRNIGYLTIHNAENFYGMGRFFGGVTDGFSRYGGPFMPWHGHIWEVGAAANGLITHNFITGEVAAPVTGEVVFVGDIPGNLNADAAAALAQELFEAADVDGKIALIGMRNPNAAIANIATANGAIGLMGHTVIGGRGNFGAAGSPNIPVANAVDIPVLGLALAQAEWLKTFLEQESVTVTIETQRYSTPVSWNAIGRKPAINNPDTAPIFYVIGHIDTVIGAPGANDNASGVAVTLEAARALSQLHTPDVELRFVGFGDEENGLRGAWRYVQRLPQAERDRIRGVFNMDMTASAAYDEAPYWVMATVDGLPNLVTQTFIATADRLGFEGILQQAMFSSSDHVPFHFNGIQQANQRPNPFVPSIPAAMGIWLGRVNEGMITPSNFTVEFYYHTPQDTIWENVCKDRLEMCIQIVSAAVYYMARNYLKYYANASVALSPAMFGGRAFHIESDIHELNGSWSDLVESEIEFEIAS